MFNVYAWGLCFASVCTSLDDEIATSRLNVELPTGIASQWHVHADAFADGTPNGAQCPDDPACRHVLFSC